MANNYLQFSEAINNITPEEAEWSRARLQEMTDKFSDSCGDEGWYFEWAIHEAHSGEETPHIWLYAEEGGEPDHVAEFVQEFLNKFRPSESFSLTWACFCSKPRVGEFDGGGIFVTAKDVKWFVPVDLIEKARNEFENSLKKGKKK